MRARGEGKWAHQALTSGGFERICGKVGSSPGQAAVSQRHTGHGLFLGPQHAEGVGALTAKGTSVGDKRQERG